MKVGPLQQLFFNAVIAFSLPSCQHKTLIRPSDTESTAQSYTTANPSALPPHRPTHLDAPLIYSLIVQHRFDDARTVLRHASIHDPYVALEQGRLLLHETQYEAAGKVLQKPEISALPQGKRLAQLARQCEACMVGAYTVQDTASRVIVRMQDDRDTPLVPLIVQVVDGIRNALADGLGVDLPVPLRIELVRDHFSLSLMTGLSEQAARTTGTVAIANYGRVAMVSPRAIVDGYSWMDTLAHELTHVALTIGSADRAPLWLQEGVAKYFETKWRTPTPYDNNPSPDAIARAGFELGLARSFDDLGTSVAMMPSPREAMVVYAQVESFVRYLVSIQGKELLTELVPRIARAPLLPPFAPSRLYTPNANTSTATIATAPDNASFALQTITGHDLSYWYDVWEKWLLNQSIPTPKQLQPPDKYRSETLMMARRDARLGKLLLDQQHYAEASTLLLRARSNVPNDLHVRFLLANSYYLQNDIPRAYEQLQNIGPPMLPNANAIALAARLQYDSANQGNPDHEAPAHTPNEPPLRERSKRSFALAVSLNPWSEQCACEFLPPPQLPTNDERAWLCQSARQYARENLSVVRPHETSHNTPNISIPSSGALQP